MIVVAFEIGYDVANGLVALLLSRVEFERRNAVVDGMVVLPLRPVMGEISYPDPRIVAPALKPLLRYVPSCRTLDAVVCEAVALATESVVVCGTVVATYPRPIGLATVLVGDDPASDVYIRMKHKATVEVGIEARDLRAQAPVPPPAAEPEPPEPPEPEPPPEPDTAEMEAIAVQPELEGVTQSADWGFGDAEDFSAPV